MVYITAADGIEKKYACIKCIKGHRSSKCTHRDRELFEIKRKGRPVSQCESCRYLRKTKQVHIKCMCHVNKDQDTNMLITDQGFKYSDLNSTNSTTSCNRCDGQNDNELIFVKEEYDELPIYQDSASRSNHDPLSVTVTPTTSLPASPSHTASPITNKPFNRHLTIPIHDPSDDIDSDTPIYKPVDDLDDKQPLGEFTSKSSDELINQIYSGFDPTNSSTSSPLLREDDDQLIEISKDP